MRGLSFFDILTGSERTHISFLPPVKALFYQTRGDAYIPYSGDKLNDGLTIWKKEISDSFSDYSKRALFRHFYKSEIQVVTSCLLTWKRESACKRGL